MKAADLLTKLQAFVTRHPDGLVAIDALNTCPDIAGTFEIDQGDERGNVTGRVLIVTTEDDITLIEQEKHVPITTRVQ